VHLRGVDHGLLRVSLRVERRQHGLLLLLLLLSSQHGGKQLLAVQPACWGCVAQRQPAECVAPGEHAKSGNRWCPLLIRPAPAWVDSRQEI
jgi:hypothetical protein